MILRYIGYLLRHVRTYERTYEAHTMIISGVAQQAVLGWQTDVDIDRPVPT